MAQRATQSAASRVGESLGFDCRCRDSIPLIRSASPVSRTESRRCCMAADSYPCTWPRLSLGNRSLPYAAGVRRVHDSLGWLSQILMFLLLGLLVFPSRVMTAAGVGLGVALVLAFVARPLVVWLCLTPFRLSAR